MLRNNHFYKIDILILSLLSKKDLSCLEMTHYIHELSIEYINIKVGVLFTFLFHLEQAHLISSYKDTTTMYHIEEAGRTRLEMLIREYEQMISGTKNLLNYHFIEE